LRAVKAATLVCNSPGSMPKKGNSARTSFSSTKLIGPERLVTTRTMRKVCILTVARVLVSS